MTKKILAVFLAVALLAGLGSVAACAETVYSDWAEISAVYPPQQDAPAADNTEAPADEPDLDADPAGPVDGAASEETEEPSEESEPEEGEPEEDESVEDEPKKEEPEEDKALEDERKEDEPEEGKSEEGEPEEDKALEDEPKEDEPEEGEPEEDESGEDEPDFTPVIEFLALTEEEQESYLAALQEEDPEAYEAFLILLEAYKAAAEEETAEGEPEEDESEEDEPDFAPVIEFLALTEEEQESYLAALQEEDPEAYEAFLILLEAYKAAAEGEEAEETEETEGPTVTIYSDQRDVMEEGEIVTLTSELKGFEQYDELLLVWEVNRGDDAGWIELEDGVNTDTYSFPASAETLSWSWRLNVYYR